MPSGERQRLYRDRVRCILDAHLRQMGVSAREAARALGMSQQGLQNIKLDRTRAAQWETLAAMADYIGCEIGDLFAFARRRPLRDDFQRRARVNGITGRHDDGTVVVSFAVEDGRTIGFRVPAEDLILLAHRAGIRSEPGPDPGE